MRHVAALLADAIRVRRLREWADREEAARRAVSAVAIGVQVAVDRASIYEIAAAAITQLAEVARVEVLLDSGGSEREALVFVYGATYPDSAAVGEGWPPRGAGKSRLPASMSAPLA